MTEENLSKLHPSELSDHILYRLRSTAGMWGAILLSASLGLGSLAIDDSDGEPLLHWLKTGLVGGGYVSAMLAYAMKENVTQRSLITLDAQDISAASRQQRYYEAMKPQAETATIELPQEPWKPDLFDWGRLIIEPDKFPHILLLGATGDGKTTLAEWLHSAMDAEPIAVHPHWQPSDDPTDPADFAYCHKVVGGGRNFSEIKKFVSEVHKEMDVRSKLTRSQLHEKPIFGIAIDELPAIAKNCGETTTEEIISLLFEARKFRIRLLLLAQADSVKILGLEGQGAVRENLTYIRLGNYALDHARWLVNRKLAQPELIEWLEMQHRPCMVEDAPAMIPSIRKGQSLNGFFLGNSSPVSTGSQSSFFGGAIEGAIEGAPPAPSTSPGAPPAPTPAPPSALDFTPAPAPAPFDPLSPDIQPEEFIRVVALRQEGHSQDAIIKAVYDCNKSGTSQRYIAAREKYRLILNKAGLN